MSEDRKINCNLPGHDGEFVVRAKEISFGNWQAWNDADTVGKTVALIPLFVESWSLKGTSGKPLPAPSEPEWAHDASVKLIMWLVKAVTDSIVAEMRLDPK